MSITRTRFLKIINADKGDDIPAGTKTDSTTPLNDLNNSGRNGDMQKVDEAIGLEHNPSGTHKVNVVTGANLVQTGGTATVDESTLEFSANKMRVKAGGITSTELAADAATSAEISTNFKATGRQIYGDIKEAGTAPGNTPPASTEWTETSTITVQKVQFFFRKVADDTKCKLVADAKTTSGTWRVRLSVAGTIIDATGTNTAYAAAPEVVIEVDISAFANDNVFKVFVELSVVAGGPTASLSAPIVTITQD